jgi:hypothetical protein
MLRQCLVLSLCVFSLTARAQEGAPEERVPLPGPAGTEATPQTLTVPQSTPTTETTAPSIMQLPAAPPPPPPAPAASTIATIAQTVIDAVRIYGTLKPTITLSSAGVESFSNPNAGAVTAAANPVLANLRDEARLSFQVAQSRFGLWLNEKGPVRGHFEFDFIDFTKASPTTQALLRLRIATVEYNPVESLTIALGQDWDLDAPLNPFGVNLVGAHFQGGNHGFMRQQLKVIGKATDSLELALAVGLQGSNPTAKDGAVELARVPTFAARVTGTLGKLGKIGISGIATQLRFAPGAENQRKTFAGGGTLFADLAPYETLSIRLEAYAGQNLSNLGMLAIGNGGVANDIGEAGGFISVRQTFLEQHGVYATYGQARVFDGDHVVPSYAYAATSGDTPAFSTAALAGTGPGIQWNHSARLGYEFKPLKGLTIALEGFWYKTLHSLVAVDQSRVSGSVEAFGSDLAMLYAF